MKNTLKKFWELNSNLKSTLKVLIDNGVQLQNVRITPEVNDWLIEVSGGPVISIGPVKDNELYLELDPKYKNYPIQVKEDYVLLNMKDTVQFVNDLYGEGEDKVEVTSKVTFECDYLDSSYEESLFIKEINNLLNEEIIARAQKARAEELCNSALKYLNRYFIETSDERIFPKRFFRGKTFRHVYKNMLKYEYELLKIQQRGRVNHLLCTIDSAFWHLNCMRRYGRRVPRNGSKIS